MPALPIPRIDSDLATVATRRDAIDNMIVLLTGRIIRGWQSCLCELDGAESDDDGFYPRGKSHHGGDESEVSTYYYMISRTYLCSRC